MKHENKNFVGEKLQKMVSKNQVFSRERLTCVPEDNLIQIRLHLLYKCFPVHKQEL